MQQAANYLSRAEGWDSWRKRDEQSQQLGPSFDHLVSAA
jgi:hypothetical protein